MNRKNENMSLQEATIKALYNELDDSDEIRDVEGVVDDVLVVTDPEITKDEYEEVIERAQEIVEDTPEGDLPFDEDYIGQYLQTCPICGSSFVEDHLLEPGATCPICLEQPEAFVVVGKIDSDVAVEDELGLGEDDFDVEDDFDTGNEFNLGRDESEEDITDVESTPDVEEEPNENFERSGGRRASNLGRNREVASKEVPQGNKLAESKLEESASEIDYTKIKSAIEDLDAETQSMIGTDEGVENEYADGYKWATDICLDIVDMCKSTGEDLIESIESKKSELGTESEEMSDDALTGATDAYRDVLTVVENFLNIPRQGLNESKEDVDTKFTSYCQQFRQELDDTKSYIEDDWTYGTEEDSENHMTLEDMGNLVSKELANIGFELGLVGYTFTKTDDINIAKSELIDIVKDCDVENKDSVIQEIESIGKVDIRESKTNNTFICDWCGTKFQGEIDNEGRMPNCPHCLEDRYKDDENRLKDGYANKDVHLLDVETEEKTVKTENKIVIDNMGETYTINTDAKTYTIKTSKGEKTFPFEKMDEFVKGYRGVNRLHKPMSVLAYTDFKNGALRNWNVVGGEELVESVTVDNNAVCKIDLDLTKNGKVKDTVKLAIKGIDHTTDKISRAVQTRYGGKFKSEITGKVYSQDIYVADDLWLTFAYYDEPSDTLVFVLDGDISKDPELTTKKEESVPKHNYTVLRNGLPEGFYCTTREEAEQYIKDLKSRGITGNYKTVNSGNTSKVESKKKQ